MKAFKKIQSSKIYKLWLMSFLLVLTLPLIFNLVNLGISHSRLSKSIRNDSVAQLKHSASNIDNILDCIFSVTNTYANSNYANTIATLTESLTADSRYELLSHSSNSISVYDSMPAYVLDSYLYIASSNTVFSNGYAITPHAFFLANYSNQTSFSYDTWVNNILSSSYSHFVTLGKEGEKRIFYVSTTGKTQDSLGIVAVAEVNIDNILSSCFSFEQKDNVFIYDSNGSVVYSKNHENNSTIKTALAINEDDVITVNKNMLLLCNSQFDGLGFGILLPKNVYQQTIYNSLFLNIFMTVLMIILSIVISIALIQKNMRPLNELIKLISSNTDNRDYIFDEYKYINNSILDLINKKLTIENKLSTQHTILRNATLINILIGETSGNAAITAALHSINVSYSSDYFFIAVLYIDNVSNIFNESDALSSTADKQENKALSRVIVTNIVDELLSKSYTADIVEISDFLVCVINVPDGNCDTARRHITEILSEAQNFIENNFHFVFSAGLSAMVSSPSSWQSAYSEATFAAEYAQSFDNAAIIDCTSVSVNTNEHYPYNTEIEQTLINHLKMCEFEQCSNDINMIIDRCIGIPEMTLNMARFISYDILSCFLKATVSKENKTLCQIIITDSNYNSIHNSSTIKTTFQNLKSLCEKCIEILQSDMTTLLERKMQNVKNYVDEHYDNPDLNVSAVADAFNMNLSNLSTNFHQIYNIKLIDYISKKRTEHAKELLLYSDYTLNEISLIVGYTNQRTLIRTFQRLEGVTPTQFKQIHK